MEYESRRDADDAYHEMHNKRIGRDDLLKIEVSSYQLTMEFELTCDSGLVLHLRLRGVLILAATAPVVSVVAAVTVLLVVIVAVASPRVVAVVITLLARTIVVTVTMTAATATVLGAQSAMEIAK